MFPVAVGISPPVWRRFQRRVCPDSARPRTPDRSVLTLQVFEDEAEAVALANDSEYGLAASVWTRDVDRSLRIAQALDAGSVWINDWTKVYDSTEEGGFKQSGLGRMNGLAALDDFIEYKHIALKPGLLVR